MPLSAQET